MSKPTFNSVVKNGITAIATNRIVTASAIQRTDILPGVNNMSAATMATAGPTTTPAMNMSLHPDARLDQ